MATGYPWFKAAVFGLLACNTAVFLATGTASEALDAAAWLVLLASFELETGLNGRFREAPGPAIFRGVRLGAAVAILAAAIGYVGGGEWLDAINIGLWIAVVALLEFEIRRPLAVAAHRARFAAATMLLYAGLGVPILVWAGRGEWFDAYDALLWLVAFATIEIDVFRFARQVTAGSPSG
jgi:hypothetical protein